MSSDDRPQCMQRRNVLCAAGTGGLAISFGMSDIVAGAEGAARLDESVYPRLKLGALSALEEGKPVSFIYPLKQQPNMLVKLGKPALHGIGPDNDIVAFSVLCTHMGGSLRGRYRHEDNAIGPCPFHFSAFDLRKGGIPVHASATQNLPQIVLSVDGGDIVAEGVIGLIYGYRNNLTDGELADGAEPGGADARIIMRG